MGHPEVKANHVTVDPGPGKNIVGFMEQDKGQRWKIVTGYQGVRQNKIFDIKILQDNSGLFNISK